MIFLNNFCIETFLQKTHRLAVTRGECSELALANTPLEKV